MKGRVGWTAVAVLFLTAVAHATTLTVTDIKVAQRYPWNGLVDITYTVNCDDPTKDVWVYPVGYDADNDKTVAMMPAHLTGDGAGKAVKSGTHRMTWDMATAMGKDYNRAAFSVKMHAFCDAAPYMVIDLSSGSESERYEVSYLAEEPEGGWGEEYLTTKMVFRLILPGRSYTCSLTNSAGDDDNPVNNVETVVDEPYYFAIFPITQRQWCLINGGSTTTPTKCKYAVSYYDLRGKILGSKWPLHQQVDADSACGKMRLRTGMTVDIPTYAQWYRAISADFMHDSFVTTNAWGVCDLSIDQTSREKRNGEWGRELFSYNKNTSTYKFAVVLGRNHGAYSQYMYRYLGGWARSAYYFSHEYTHFSSAPYLTGSEMSEGRYNNDSSDYPFSARLVVCPVSK